MCQWYKELDLIIVKDARGEGELWVGVGWVLLVDGSEIPIGGVVDGVGSME